MMPVLNWICCEIITVRRRIVLPPLHSIPFRSVPFLSSPFSRRQGPRLQLLSLFARSHQLAERKVGAKIPVVFCFLSLSRFVLCVLLPQSKRLLFHRRQRDRRESSRRTAERTTTTERDCRDDERRRRPEYNGSLAWNNILLLLCSIWASVAAAAATVYAMMIQHSPMRQTKGSALSTR